MFKNTVQVILKTEDIGVICQNDQKRCKSTGAFFNNSAINLKIIWPKKLSCSISNFFLKKETSLPTKSAGDTQGTSSQNATTHFAG